MTNLGIATKFSESAQAFLRTWGSPEQSYRSQEQTIRQQRYARLWDLYQGTAFQDMEAWSSYRQAFGLYRQTRLIWDHVHSLVEFYACHLYPGSLADDGLHLPDGVANAIPLAQDTKPEIASAIGQLWSWWNFQESKNTLVRYTAALGEMLVEIKDDPERGRVFVEMIWPAYIKDIRLDEAGNVTYYCIQYQAWDQDKKEFFTYKREVDKASFRTFKNGSPFSYRDYATMSVDGGQVSFATEGSYQEIGDVDSNSHVTENPYGFVPAVWFRHIRTLGVRGEPAIWATQAELDEVNSLFSHMIDKAHISLRAPIVVSGNIAPNMLKTALTNMVGATKRLVTDELDEPYADRESLNILQGPTGTNVSTIELKISEATEALDRIIAGIERKTPEVTFYEQLRGMTQITGPAAGQLLGDVQHKVMAIASGYDQQLIKLMQMAIAISGWRFGEGEEGWSEKNSQQEKFAPFDLESYKKGDLNFNIMPRDLLPMTPKERVDLIIAKKAALPQIPASKLAMELGYHEDEFAIWEKEYDKKQEDMMQQQQEAQLTQMAAKKPVGAPPGGPQRGSPKQNRGES